MPAQFFCPILYIVIVVAQQHSLAIAIEIEVLYIGERVGLFSKFQATATVRCKYNSYVFGPIFLICWRLLFASGSAHLAACRTMRKPSISMSTMLRLKSLLHNFIIYNRTDLTFELFASPSKDVSLCRVCSLTIILNTP